MYPAKVHQPLSMAQVVQHFPISVHIAQDFTAKGAAPLHLAQQHHISFYENPAYKSQVPQTQAGAVFIKPEDAELLPASCIAMVTPMPYAAFAMAVAALYPTPAVIPAQQGIVHPTAKVDASAQIDTGAVIEANVTIAAGVHIASNTVVGEGVSIAENTRVGANCTLLNCTIGKQCIIQPGVRVGQDGFGFTRQGDKIHKIPQIGTVRIGNNVEIGAGTTIDRGALAETVIGDHCKLDCQVQIAHNVQLGQGVRVVAQTGIAGSTKVGDFSLIGGQSGIAGHIELAPETSIAARSGVTKSILESGQTWSGFPAMPHNQWKKLQAKLARLLKNG